MTDKLTAAQVAQIEAALARGEKISAIKLYRDFTGVGLKESKEVIDQRSGELLQRDPVTYAKLAKRGSGCASVIALGLAAAAVALWVWRSAITQIPAAR
jgi:hypothetical protein